MAIKDIKNVMSYRRKIYDQAKKLKLNVKWGMKTSQIEKIVNDHLKAILFTKLFKRNQAKFDNDALNTINSYKPIKLSLTRFNRIRKNIVAPSDKKLILVLKDSNDAEIKSYHLEDEQINIYNLFVSEDNFYSSGADVDLSVYPFTYLELKWIDNPKSSKSEQKKFFRYLTKADYGLEEFQVYSESTEFDDKSFDPSKDSDIDAKNYPCFLFSLLKSGVDVKTIIQISQSMFKYGVTTAFIKRTANDYGLYISVKSYKINKSNNKINTVLNNYGSSTSKNVKLGSVGEHLFAIKPTKITKDALNNPEKVSTLGVSFKLRNKHVKPVYLDSFQVISYLYHNRETLLTPITQSSAPSLLNNKFQEVRTLNECDFNETNFEDYGRNDKIQVKNGRSPFTIKEEKRIIEVNDYNVVYFDFETLIIDDIHTPYAISYSISTDGSNTTIESFSETKCIYGLNCEIEFLNSLPKDSLNLLWAHNAGFDCRFLLKHMSFKTQDTNMIDSGTKLKQVSGFFKGKEIIIRDTYSFIASPLSDLPSMFQDNCKSISLTKECFPHDLIDLTNYKSMWSLDYLDSFENKDILIENAIAINAISDNMFDCKKYAIHYCNRDVDVLKTCFEAFRYLTKNAFDLDVYRFLSISSLAISYQFNEGCFDGCYSFNSVLLGFVREAVVGGRVMTRDNQKHHRKNDLINKLSTNSKHKFISYLDKYNKSVDKDIVSFIDKFECQNIDDFNKMRTESIKYIMSHRLENAERIITLIADFDAVSLYPSAMAELKGYTKGKAKLFKATIPSDADYYIAKVRITSLKTTRHFPLQSRYENGSRNFTNDLVNYEIILGKQALEDLVEFQGVTYEIIEGMYWNEGFNDQITKTIKKMFNERLKYKSEGNSLQVVLKLMMNSSYGKLLMKPIVKRKMFVSGNQKKINDYMCKNIHKMISKTPINNNLALFEEYNSMIYNFSPAHLGVQVLDASKHIMNQVMCLAEDIHANIWYQDTDSMHIDYNAVSKLAEAFKKKYGKELIGKHMGQFHIDFDLKGSKGNIYATESIFLGKKSYLDILACDGNDVKGMHIRMKGIPSKLLKENTINKYTKLYNGECMSFDLTKACPINIDSKTQKVTKRSSFFRSVQFN